MAQTLAHRYFSSAFDASCERKRSRGPPPLSTLMKKPWQQVSAGESIRGRNHRCQVWSLNSSPDCLYWPRYTAVSHCLSALLSLLLLTKPQDATNEEYHDDTAHSEDNNEDQTMSGDGGAAGVLFTVRFIAHPPVNWHCVTLSNSHIEVDDCCFSIGDDLTSVHCTIWPGGTCDGEVAGVLVECVSSVLLWFMEQGSIIKVEDHTFIFNFRPETGFISGIIKFNG